MSERAAVPQACLLMVQDMRINFQFDKAGFALSFLPFKIPYPVPFKLLGDETKGWIDITYLSEDGQLRLTRGNKGTHLRLTFNLHMPCIT